MKRVEQKKQKKVCIECRGRRALFRYRGVVKWDPHHTLCFRCWRGQTNRMRTLTAVAQQAFGYANAA